MKQTLYILVGLCLWACPWANAQQLAPTQSYRDIQYNTSYDASGLHLQTDGLKRNIQRPTLLFKAGNLSSVSNQMQVGVEQVVTVAPTSTFRAGVWSGQVTSVGGDISEAALVKRYAIGNGNKPNNSVHVPIGNAPWLLLSLIALAYACHLSRRLRKA